MKRNNPFLLLLSTFILISFAPSIAIANGSLSNDNETHYDDSDTYDNSNDTDEDNTESEDIESNGSEVEEKSEYDKE